MYVVCTVHVPCGDGVRRLGTTGKHWGLKLNNKITENSKRETESKAMIKRWKHSKRGWMKREQKERSLQELVRRIRIQIQCKGIERAARDNSTTSRGSRGVEQNKARNIVTGGRRQVENELSNSRCWATTKQERLRRKYGDKSMRQSRQVNNEQGDSMCGTKQERLRRRQVYNEQSDWKCWRQNKARKIETATSQQREQSDSRCWAKQSKPVLLVEGGDKSRTSRLTRWHVNYSYIILLCSCS